MRGGVRSTNPPPPAQEQFIYLLLQISWRAMNSSLMEIGVNKSIEPFGVRTALIETTTREQIACYLSVDFDPLRSRHFDKPSVALDRNGFIVKHTGILHKERDRQVVSWSRSVSTSYNGPCMTSEQLAPSSDWFFRIVAGSA